MIYVINQESDVGDVITTRWSFRRNASEGWYTEFYEYQVDEIAADTPKIIINDAFASVPGQFRFEALLNGKKMGERFINVVE